ncbi:MAG TPA: transporter substrate-binding domain-containing protein [Kofleriaceae bacterium]|nr:transporter substrate-binding domain-containing protein [Kofleriaceae bacterium]
MRVCVRGDVAPFGSFSNTGLEGFEIELANEIVKQISIDYKQVLKVDWTVVSAGERIPRLVDDGCDLLVASLSYTPERATQVATSKVYLKTDKVLLAAAKITRTTPVIAKIAGTTGDAGGLKGTERTFASYQELVYAMDEGQIDYLVTDRPIAEHLIRSATRPYSITKTLSTASEAYVAATNKARTDVLAAVDKALTDLAKSGRLALLQRRWL